MTPRIESVPAIDVPAGCAAAPAATTSMSVAWLPPGDPSGFWHITTVVAPEIVEAAGSAEISSLAVGKVIGAS
jgi:hypothetical protein